MDRPLSMDPQDRVIGAIDTGISRRAVAPRYGVSVAGAIRWDINRRATGSYARLYKKSPGTGAVLCFMGEMRPQKHCLCSIEHAQHALLSPSVKFRLSRPISCSLSGAKG